MEQIGHKRNYSLIAETAFILLLAAVFVTKYLVVLYNKWDALYTNTFNQHEVSVLIDRYNIRDFYIRTDVQYPVIAAAILLALGWVIFHTGVIPQAVKRRWDPQVLLLIILSAILVATSLFVYHYFREYFRPVISYNPWSDFRGQDRGIKIYSLYRMRTVVTDFFAVLVMFGVLELALGACHRFRRLLKDETDAFYRIMAYLPTLLLGILFVFIVFVLRLQTPLWREDLRYFLYLGGIGLTVWLMQEFITIEYRPEMHRTDRGKFYALVSGLVAIWFCLSFLIWACFDNFYFHREERYALILIITLLGALAIAVPRRYFFKRNEKLERLSTETLAELAHLRTQINPHFLFNALNSLYTAAHREKSETTAEGIQRLADIMRFMLSENNHERILLEKEIQYLENYLYIQRLRVDETQGVDINVSLSLAMPQAYIAPMMLIPFVENAFKHGISHKSPSWIHVTLAVDNGKLDFHVANSRHKKTAHDPEKFQGGIGLPNIRKRLELIYAHRYTLDIKETNDEYSARLTLQLW